MKSSSLAAMAAVLVCAVFPAPGASAAGLTDQEIKAAYYKSYKTEKGGDFKHAIADLEPVYQAYPTGYTINLRIGWLHYLDGKHANAKYHYENAIKVAPSSVDAKLGYTLPLLAQQDWAKVEAVCYQIVKVDYYDYYANLRLAFALRMQGKLDLAKEVSYKMLAIHPSDTLYLTELALDLEAVGDKKSSSAIYLDILTMDPYNATALVKFPKK